jgi:hypothetical protein
MEIAKPRAWPVVMIAHIHLIHAKRTLIVLEGKHVNFPAVAEMPVAIDETFAMTYAKRSITMQIANKALLVAKLCLQYLTTTNQQQQ